MRPLPLARCPLARARRHAHRSSLRPRHRVVPERPLCRLQDLGGSSRGAPGAIPACGGSGSRVGGRDLADGGIRSRRRPGHGCGAVREGAGGGAGPLVYPRQGPGPVHPWQARGRPRSDAAAAPGRGWSSREVRCEPILHPRLVGARGRRRRRYPGRSALGRALGLGAARPLRATGGHPGCARPLGGEGPGRGLAGRESPRPPGRGLALPDPRHPPHRRALVRRSGGLALGGGRRGAAQHPGGDARGLAGWPAASRTTADALEVPVEMDTSMRGGATPKGRAGRPRCSPRRAPLAARLPERPRAVLRPWPC